MRAIVSHSVGCAKARRPGIKNTNTSLRRRAHAVEPTSEGRTACARGATAPLCAPYCPLSLHRRLDQGAQLGRNLGQDPEPALKGWARLMEQHAKPIHGGIAALAGGGEEGRLARDVNNVRDE